MGRVGFLRSTYIRNHAAERERSHVKITFYNAAWATMGGGEKYLAAMADVAAQSGNHTVTLLIDSPSLTLDLLRTRFGLGLRGVGFQRIDRRYVRNALRKADLACIVSNVLPFGHPAPATVYVMQVPHRHVAPASILAMVPRMEIHEAAKSLSRFVLLRDARRSNGVLVYSQFAANVLEREHSIRATVLYPPIDDFAPAPPLQKQKIILSVGRIFRGLYNDKRYDILLDGFRQLFALPGMGEWEYWIAGACATDHESQSYLHELRRQAAGLPVRFLVNVSHQELRDCYARASLFWHGAGYGVDETQHPDRTEHFGMSTVESMSAFCIPLVVAKGGQKEIVSDGESGYLWNTLDELVHRTVALASDPSRLVGLREGARVRYTAFSRSVFEESVRTFLDSIRRF